MNAFFDEVVDDSEKYKQMLFEFLQNNISKKGKVPKTKLASMLYLADFGWYYENLESMSGMRYRKIAHGIVPDDYFRIICELYDEGKLNIEVEDSAILVSPTAAWKRKPINKLSKKEKDFIKKIAKKWKNKKTKEIVAFTKNQRPYIFCNDGEMVPYELITQEDPGYAY